ncbi:hypothetical protein RHSIM_Rhsim13G0112900 [Rhododendron simsii]|uniref:Pollen Ole e 1 allergen and extensin family protein n=1 Tax=Rhododendron simsii TaxID=118357 RepID=A0A834G4G7_RHOSS|nr:hypothetical protein RHSIM_Rhsim13G0112900 [Rhododendron simsii]
MMLGWISSFMGIHHLIISALLVFALVLAKFELSTSYVLKGSVHCLDCKYTHDHDLSGIKVQVKCSQVKKLAIATTGQDGTFQTELPSDTQATTQTSPSSCRSKLLGGPSQLYVSKKNMVSEIAKVPSESNSYTVSTPLMFYTSCPLAKNDHKCRARDAGVSSSKTIDVPFPPEWGLAPSSYYINPFIPIIGIP